MASRKLHQMRLRAPHGRTEVVWVQDGPDGTYRLLNVPVFFYGVSVGTLVRGRMAQDAILEYVDIVEPSPGGTVRCMVPKVGPIASDFYRRVLGPRATENGIGVGPATFLDPLIVAVHLHDRSLWDTAVADLLNGFVRMGELEHWEVGDPDEYGDEQPVAQVDSLISDDVLVHPRPTTDRTGYFSL